MPRHQLPTQNENTVAKRFVEEVRMAQAEPTKKLVLGLDVGQRRIGIALSDSLGLTAQGLTVLKRQSLAVDIKAICALVACSTA